MNDINKTLQERGGKYGRMEDNARVTQKLMGVLREESGYDNLSMMHKECLHMIMHKISRMMCGDPWYADNAHDIVGYAKLLEDYQNEEQQKHA